MSLDLPELLRLGSPAQTLQSQQLPPPSLSYMHLGLSVIMLCLSRCSASTALKIKGKLFKNFPHHARGEDKPLFKS